MTTSKNKTINPLRATYMLAGPDGERTTCTSERAARAVARTWLGCRRIHESPTVVGWHYWDAADPSEDAPCVTVTVSPITADALERQLTGRKPKPRS